MLRRIVAVVTLLYILSITVLSLAKFSIDINNDELFTHFDKFVHFCFYFGLNILLIIMTWLCSGRKALSLISIVCVTAVSILYSVMIECVQPYFGREQEFMDGVANIIGSLSGATLYLVYRYLRTTRSSAL